MAGAPRNVDAGLEQLDRASRSVSQAGHELRGAHVAIGNVPDLTARLLDLYVEIDRVHDRIRDVMGDLSARRHAS